MAEKKKEESKTQEVNDFKTYIDEAALVDAALEDDKKAKDEDTKRKIRDVLGCATYDNVKTRAELRARRREEEITKERLNGTKLLVERLIGRKCEIKDGRLVPTKEKCTEPRISHIEYKDEKRKLKDEISKKISESNKQLDKDLRELRDSYEGRYAYWWD